MNDIQLYMMYMTVHVLDNLYLLNQMGLIFEGCHVINHTFCVAALRQPLFTVLSYQMKKIYHFIIVDL